jgi:hypothetical protein
MSPLATCRWGGFADPVDNVRAFHPGWHSVLSTVRATACAAGPFVHYGQSLARYVETHPGYWLDCDGGLARELKLPLNRPSAEAMASVKGGVNRRAQRAHP